MGDLFGRPFLLPRHFVQPSPNHIQDITAISQWNGAKQFEVAEDEMRLCQSGRQTRAAIWAASKL
jgi:hypothetical protein